MLQMQECLYIAEWAITRRRAFLRTSCQSDAPTSARSAGAGCELRPIHRGMFRPLTMPARRTVAIEIWRPQHCQRD